MADAAVTYSTPGKYTLVVPSGVSEMSLTATGGGGGGDARDAYPGVCYAGKGGLETASFAVTEGAKLDITVAGKGGDGGTASQTAGAAGGTGGVGGGGAGGNVGPAGDNVVVAGYGGGGGGGASTVSVGGNPLLVAAGGGGCAAPVAASSTGGGKDGSAGSSSDMGGGGAGTLTAGGGGGGVVVSCWGGVPGTSGTAGQGGSGGGGASVGGGGGGGGAGYYGGGGGGGGLYSSCASASLSGGGGGGGSDYASSAGCHATNTPGYNSGNGSVTIDFSTHTASDHPARASSLNGGCPLVMRITEGDTQIQSPFDMTSGLSLSRHPERAANIDPSDIVFKTGSLSSIADGGTFPGHCLSGCTDLMVQVGQGYQYDAQNHPIAINDPVDGATVTATITGVSADGKIANSDALKGWVCTVEAAGSSPFGTSVKKDGLTCGRGAVTGETDSVGQVRFRYWGPASWGSNGDARPEVHVKFKAEASQCSSSISCLHAQSDDYPAVINVLPNVVWWRNAHLTKSERAILVDWVKAGKITSGLSSFVGTLGKLKVFDNLKLLKYLKKVAKNVKLGKTASDTIVLFWFIRKFGIATEGLYDPKFNFANIESQLLGLIKNPALSFIANKLATELFGTNHEFDKQVLDVLKRYGGNGPGTLEANRNDHIPYVMTLKAYEASYCTGSDFWCGGPDNQTLLPGTRHTQGVHFNLYFAFSSEDGSAPGTAVFFRPGKSTFNVDTAYIPRTWIPAQCRIRCVGFGEPPPD